MTIKLYHTPISFNSRRVWVTLLEKKLDFELINLKLDGDQFLPDFIALNPFHHIPVLVDDDFSLFESLAILDYLEAQYPAVPLIPSNPQSLGRITCLIMVTINELLPALQPWIRQAMGLGKVSEEQLAESQVKIATILSFLADYLGNNPFLASEVLTMADIVTGTVIPLLPRFGLSLAAHPNLVDWSQRLSQRPSWQQTEATAADLAAFKATMQKIMAKRQANT